MPKTMDIEDLLAWAFQEQKVEHVAAALRPRVSGSMMSGLMQLLALGTRIDTPSAGALHFGARCHEDAAVIYDAVMALPPEAWVLVIKYARSGGQPDWHPEGPGVEVQPLDKNGRPRRRWRDPAKQRGDLGLAPPVLVGTPPVIVDYGRKEWAVWQAALVDLVAMVNAEMVDHQAEGPRAPAEPWNGDGVRAAS